MSLGAALANRAWGLVASRAHRAFVRALADAEGVQRRILAGYLRRNAETEFGRAHGFARLKDAEVYAATVPVADFSACRADFERIAAGEQRLRTLEPVTHLALTAGTGGPAKTIPYTAALKREFAAAVGAWITDVFAADPALRDGPAYWSVSPALGRTRSSGGLPVGFEDDSAYLGRGQQLIIEHALAVPGRVSGIADVERLRRVTAAALLGRDDLRLISVWHPSFFTLLSDWIATHWDTLLNDVRHGLNVPEVGLRLPARPERARRLAALEPGNPAAIWPRLGLLSAWGDGPAARPLASLARLFPGARVQPKGIIATEALVSLPFRNVHPLAITSHYFEFELDTGDVVPSWQLRQGMRVTPLVTTGGGLYRYRIDDLLEVTGHLGSTPCLRFLTKRGQVSDLVGEKLEEGFVGRALTDLLQVPSAAAPFALLAPCRIAGVPRYALYLEMAPLGDLDGLAARLDRMLESNVHYALARRLGQLERAEVRIVPPDAEAVYLDRLVQERGQRLGEIKPLALSPLDGWDAWFCKYRTS